MKVYKATLEYDHSNPTVHMCYIDLLTHTQGEAEICEAYEQALKSVPSGEIHGLIWQQYLIYMQTCCSDVSAIAALSARAPKYEPVSKKRKSSSGHGRGHGSKFNQRRRHY